MSEAMDGMLSRYKGDRYCGKCARPTRMAIEVYPRVITMICDVCHKELQVKRIPGVVRDADEWHEE